MPNHSSTSDRITLVASSFTPAYITIETYQGDSLITKKENYWIDPPQFGDSIGTIVIDLVPILSEIRSYETPEYKSIHVTSSSPISLSGYNYRRGSGEGMLALPVTVYGKEYRTLNYPTFRIETEAYSGQYLIISPFDDNVITLRTKGYTQNNSGQESHSPGSTWQVTLQKGQSYLVRSSTNQQTTETDLTGSHITSTKPIAVISGHQYTMLDAPYGSTFFEMLPPVESWSRKYYYSNQDPERKSTVIFVAADTGDFYYTINTGSTLEQLLPGGRVEEEILNGQQLYAVTSTNSRFIAYELRRSKNIASDKKHYSPTMTLLTSPSDKDSTFVVNYPPLFDSLSTDVEEETLYQGRFEDIRELFDDPSHPELSDVPLQPGHVLYYTSSGYSDIHAASYYNRVPVAAMMRATNGTASFGHTGSLRYTKRSPDMKPPHVSFTEASCGNYTIHVNDDIVTNPFTEESGKLASVRVITYDHDLTLAAPMKNYRIVRTSEFAVGAHSDSFKLEIVNPNVDANASLYVQDLAGNDTIYTFAYVAGHTQLVTPKTVQNKIPVGRKVCFTVPITIQGDSLSTPVYVESVRLKSGLSNPTIESITPALPFVLSYGSTILVTVCATAEDTSDLFIDSLLVFADCYERSFPISGKGATGLLYATDKNFSNMQPRTTSYTDTLRLLNHGDVALSVKDFSITGSHAFSIDPSFIPPPESIQKNSYKAVTIFYTQPEHSKFDTAYVTWVTDIGVPYENSIKVTSMLTGNTIPKQSFQSSGDNSSLTISSLSPNPAGENIELAYYSASNVTVSLFDELGAQVMKFDLLPTTGSESHAHIDLTKLPQGSYVIRLQNYDSEIVSRRFVILR